MPDEKRAWPNVMWSGLLALGLGAWVVGCIAVGLLTSHSGLASAGDWIGNSAFFGASAALTFFSAARLARGLGAGREAARKAALLWGALTVAGVLLAAPALLGAASVGPDAAILVAVAAPMPVIPLLALLGAVARRHRARGVPGSPANR